MTRRNFVLSNGASPATAPLEDLKKIAEILEADGAIQVAYSFELTTALMPSSAVNDLDQKKVEASIKTLLRRIRPFGVVADMGEPIVVKAGEYQAEVDIHVVLESDVIRFTEAPWHPDSLVGEGFDRLLTMAKRGRPFMAVYAYHQAPAGSWLTVKEYANAAMFISGKLDGACVSFLRVVMDFVGEMHELSFWIEPKSEVTVSPSTSEAPAWDNLSPEGGRLTLMSITGKGTVTAPPAYVKFVLDEFRSGRTVTTHFSASLDDMCDACSNQSTAAAFIVEWLEAHGIKDPAVDVGACLHMSDGDRWFLAEFRVLDKPKKLV